MLQLIYNWQNTGSQKELFYFSNKKADDIPPDSATTKSFQCPICTTMAETPLHFVFCTHPPFVAKKTQLLDTLKKSLLRIGSHHAFVLLVSNVLRHGTIRDFKHIDHHKKIADLWNRAIILQEDIGWINFVKGMISREWVLLHDEHFRYQGVANTALVWATKVVKLLQGYLWQCWLYRNERLHGTDEDKEKVRQELQDRVKDLYKDPARYLYQTREKKQLFRLPVDKRIKQSNGTLKTWIDMVETRLRLDRETKAKVTIVRWISNKRN